MERRITQDDIIYFVVTDRFFGANKQSANPSDTRIHGGTLDGILAKLDYLLELGVTAVWVTPVYENIAGNGGSEPYHYYWPQNFEQIDPRLLDGTRLPNAVDRSTFGKFVDACEARGMKVVLDMVVNHAGYGAQGQFEPGWFNVGGSGDVEGELAGMPTPIRLNLNPAVVPPRVIDMIAAGLKHWKTGQALAVQNGHALVTVDGKTIDIFHRTGS